MAGGEININVTPVVSKQTARLCLALLENYLNASGDMLLVKHFYSPTQPELRLHFRSDDEEGDDP